MASTHVPHIQRSGVVVVVSVSGLAASGDFAGLDGGVLTGEVPRRLLLGVGGVLSASSLQKLLSVSLVLLGSDLDPLASPSDVGALGGAVGVVGVLDEVAADGALGAVPSLPIGLALPSAESDRVSGVIPSLELPLAMVTPQRTHVRLYLVGIAKKRE
jgi:hypothetical protein